MEYLDVLDQSGKKTGQRKTRADVHADGDWYKAIHAWILNSKNELLIQKRSRAKDTNPNMWDVSLAGHVSAGDTSVETVIKEAQEELGIMLDSADIEFLLTVTQKTLHKNDTLLNNEFNDVFIVHRDLDVSKLVLQEEEVAEAKFIPFTELEQKIADGDATIVPHPEEYKRLFTMLHNQFDKQ